MELSFEIQLQYHAPARVDGKKRVLHARRDVDRQTTWDDDQQRRPFRTVVLKRHGCDDDETFERSDVVASAHVGLVSNTINSGVDTTTMLSESIENSVQHNATVVEIAVVRDEGKILIFDDGDGIPPELVEAIAKPGASTVRDDSIQEPVKGPLKSVAAGRGSRPFGALDAPWGRYGVGRFSQLHGTTTQVRFTSVAKGVAKVVVFAQDMAKMIHKKQIEYDYADYRHGSREAALEIKRVNTVFGKKLNDAHFTCVEITNVGSAFFEDWDANRDTHLAHLAEKYVLHTAGAAGDAARSWLEALGVLPEAAATRRLCGLVVDGADLGVSGATVGGAVANKVADAALFARSRDDAERLARVTALGLDDADGAEVATVKHLSLYWPTMGGASTMPECLAGTRCLVFWNGLYLRDETLYPWFARPREAKGRRNDARLDEKIDSRVTNLLFLESTRLFAPEIHKRHLRDKDEGYRALHEAREADAHLKRLRKLEVEQRLEWTKAFDEDENYPHTEDSSYVMDFRGDGILRRCGKLLYRGKDLESGLHVSYEIKGPGKKAPELGFGRVVAFFCDAQDATAPGFFVAASPLLPSGDVDFPATRRTSSASRTRGRAPGGTRASRACPAAAVGVVGGDDAVKEAAKKFPAKVHALRCGEHDVPKAEQAWKASAFDDFTNTMYSHTTVPPLVFALTTKTTKKGLQAAGVELELVAQPPSGDEVVVATAPCVDGAFTLEKPEPLDAVGVWELFARVRCAPGKIWTRLCEVEREGRKAAKAPLSLDQLCKRDDPDCMRRGEPAFSRSLAVKLQPSEPLELRVELKGKRRRDQHVELGGDLEPLVITFHDARGAEVDEDSMRVKPGDFDVRGGATRVWLEVDGNEVDLDASRAKLESGKAGELVLRGVAVPEGAVPPGGSLPRDVRLHASLEPVVEGSWTWVTYRPVPGGYAAASGGRGAGFGETFPDLAALEAPSTRGRRTGSLDGLAPRAFVTVGLELTAASGHRLEDFEGYDFEVGVVDKRGGGARVHAQMGHDKSDDGVLRQKVVDGDGAVDANFPVATVALYLRLAGGETCKFFTPAALEDGAAVFNLSALVTRPAGPVVAERERGAFALVAVVKEADGDKATLLETDAMALTLKAGAPANLEVAPRRRRRRRRRAAWAVAIRDECGADASGGDPSGRFVGEDAGSGTSARVDVALTLARGGVSLDAVCALNLIPGAITEVRADGSAPSLSRGARFQSPKWTCFDACGNRCVNGMAEISCTLALDNSDNHSGVPCELAAYRKKKKKAGADAAPPAGVVDEAGVVSFGELVIDTAGGAPLPKRAKAILTPQSPDFSDSVQVDPVAVYVDPIDRPVALTVYRRSEAGVGEAFLEGEVGGWGDTTVTELADGAVVEVPAGEDVWDHVAFVAVDEAGQRARPDAVEAPLRFKAGGKGSWQHVQKLRETSKTTWFQRSSPDAPAAFEFTLVGGGKHAATHATIHVARVPGEARRIVLERAPTAASHSLLSVSQDDDTPAPAASALLRLAFDGDDAGAARCACAARATVDLDDTFGESEQITTLTQADAPIGVEIRSWPEGDDPDRFKLRAYPADGVALALAPDARTVVEVRVVDRTDNRRAIDGVYLGVTLKLFRHGHEDDVDGVMNVNAVFPLGLTNDKARASRDGDLRAKREALDAKRRDIGAAASARADDRAARADARREAAAAVARLEAEEQALEGRTDAPRRPARLSTNAGREAKLDDFRARFQRRLRRDGIEDHCVGFLSELATVDDDGDAKCVAALCGNNMLYVTSDAARRGAQAVAERVGGLVIDVVNVSLARRGPSWDAERTPRTIRKALAAADGAAALAAEALVPRASDDMSRVFAQLLNNYKALIFPDTPSLERAEDARDQARAGACDFSRIARDAPGVALRAAAARASAAPGRAAQVRVLLRARRRAAARGHRRGARGRARDAAPTTATAATTTTTPSRTASEADVEAAKARLDAAKKEVKELAKELDRQRQSTKSPRSAKRPASGVAAAARRKKQAVAPSNRKRPRDADATDDEDEPPPESIAL
ncbi:hypothetical protein JL721_9280 [Aureococcus anophagefferens]|nr:hypothetical protein JL721_9280 [Aureococcus anophagefferens]